MGDIAEEKESGYDVIEVLFCYNFPATIEDMEKVRGR